MRSGSRPTLRVRRRRAPSLPQPAGRQRAPSPARAEIRALMDLKVGVVRDALSLDAAARRLGELADAHGDDLSLVALMVTEAALRREESRGGHFRADHPAPATLAEHSETTLDALDRREAGEVRRVA